jgi:hypothetical protein
MIIHTYIFILWHSIIIAELVPYHLIAPLFSIFLLRSCARDKDLLKKRLFSSPELPEKAIFCFCRINVLSSSECLEKNELSSFLRSSCSEKRSFVDSSSECPKSTITCQVSSSLEKLENNVSRRRTTTLEHRESERSVYSVIIWIKELEEHTEIWEDENITSLRRLEIWQNVRALVR